MANGTSAFQDAQRLQANRAQTAREGILAQNALLGDSTISEELRPSPLDLPKKSYAGRASSGTPSKIADLEQSRAKQAMMRKRGEEFVGAPITAGAEQAPVSEVGSEQQQQQRQSGQAPSQEAEREIESPEQASASLSSGKARKSIREKSRRAKFAELMKNSAADQAVDKAAHQAINNFKKGLLAGSITFVSFFFWVGIVNLQLINDHTFKKSKLPKLKVWEILVTLLIDLLLAIIGIISLMIFITVVYLVVSPLIEVAKLVK